MPRPQLTLKTLLWLIVVVGAFFAGAEWAKRRWAEREASLRLELQEAEDAWEKWVLSKMEQRELKEEVEGYRERFGLIPRKEPPTGGRQLRLGTQ
jgi:hypothetical protein